MGAPHSPWVSAASLLAVLGCASVPSSLPANQVAARQARVAADGTVATGSVRVELSDLRTDRGHVLVSLFRQAQGFPDQAAQAFARSQARIQGSRAEVRFEHVPEGAFAIAVHHDEDDDLAMATGFMGIPAEGYGFSRDATGSFGPPSFEAASLHLERGALERVRIRVRY